MPGGYSPKTHPTHHIPCPLLFTIPQDDLRLFWLTIPESGSRQPHQIRCLGPNMSKKPIRFIDDASVTRAPRRGGKTFTFIDNTSIDPVVRQRIRSLVMKGRNASSKDRSAEKLSKVQSGEGDQSDADKQVALRQKKQWRKSNYWLPAPGAAFDMLSIPHAKHMTNDLKGLAYDCMLYYSAPISSQDKVQEC